MLMVAYCSIIGRVLGCSLESQCSYDLGDTHARTDPLIIYEFATHTQVCNTSKIPQRPKHELFSDFMHAIAPDNYPTALKYAKQMHQSDDPTLEEWVNVYRAAKDEKKTYKAIEFIANRAIAEIRPELPRTKTSFAQEPRYYIASTAERPMTGALVKRK